MQLKLKIIVFLSFFGVFGSLFACTAVGVITHDGTMIAKNRDYFYTAQRFEKVSPQEKFQHAYDNTYHHNNIFYAILYNDGVSMGVNTHGLVAIEEDRMYPSSQKGDHGYEKQQHRVGEADGLVLHAILQNFNSISEMLPYLDRIFSAAAPDFYQFSDANAILTVEVGNTEKNGKQKYISHLLKKKNDYFVHTNTYLNPAFQSLDLSLSAKQRLSSDDRLKAISQRISAQKAPSVEAAAAWFLETSAVAPEDSSQNMCMNLSLFRSYLQNYTEVNLNEPNSAIYGSVATMIVKNNKDLKKAQLYLRMITSVKTQSDGSQLVRYKVFQSSLYDLFQNQKIRFTENHFVRKAPIKNLCQ